MNDKSLSKKIRDSTAINFKFLLSVRGTHVPVDGVIYVNSGPVKF